ncbi:MAG: hypothetical protein M3423_00590, partial [Actinomycetota bacterium]|nr:hypothetical protein [Actinomycetota bacterium]
MEWILIALVIVAVIAAVRSTQQRQVQSHHRAQVSAEELASVKRAADEDVTEFGEVLQRLDLDLAGRDLDEAARQDYQRALDDYEAAKQSVDAVTAPEHVRHVAEILEDGRYAVACVEARAAGEPLPARRPPCFFNPQHGPSVRDVAWAPDSGRQRDVPACELDAQRVEAGADPDSRRVMVGSRRVPYWEAGPAFSPWTAGYFGAFGIMNMMFMGTMMGAAFGGSDGGYDQGYNDGQDAGQDGGDSGDSG